jgi:hypothetical protein
MKTRIWLGAIVLIAGGVVTARALTAQSPEDMKKWMEFATPGEAHKLLDGKVGKWNMKLKMVMAPGAPAQESTATSEAKWIMDGRYVEDITKGTFNEMPFEGRGLVGYDNLKKKYVGTWIDNMGTGIGTSEGTWDAAAKTFNYASEMPDPMAGKYVKTRMTEKMIDKDHWVMAMHCAGPDGKEFMSMEIDYQRAK